MNIVRPDSRFSMIAVVLAAAGLAGCGANPTATLQASGQAALACWSAGDCAQGFECVGGSCALACGGADACDDGDACTDDSCVGNACLNTAKDCDDGAACTDDACDAGTCTHADNCAAGERCNAATGACDATCAADSDCDDGAFCNGAEACVGGSCAPGAPPCGGGECDEGTRRCLTGPTPTVDGASGAVCPPSAVVGDGMWTIAWDGGTSLCVWVDGGSVTNQSADCAAWADTADAKILYDNCLPHWSGRDATGAEGSFSLQPAGDGQFHVELRTDGEPAATGSMTRDAVSGG
jgi:hypothetical protein